MTGLSDKLNKLGGSSHHDVKISPSTQKVLDRIEDEIDRVSKKMVKSNGGDPSQPSPYRGIVTASYKMYEHRRQEKKKKKQAEAFGALGEAVGALADGNGNGDGSGGAADGGGGAAGDGGGGGASAGCGGGGGG
ncbi:hypothetical protein I302_106726 [Kwoniella bestiolae CBS 10118]|uniref:Uncharacterized protein n=1 Tax=Kwoniella bestiolae CBS 10118 TaxID=1296100 RepID=A0A1B9G0K5_9TREE|nr:hypothetical protein I302_06010 [Kwoniella bestiolae CBS 10118]OCF24549.1 hypothetical protein I302_06010 [Kwoniella bestiolae CBS 10118]